MANKTVIVGLQGNTVTKDPETVVAEHKTKPTIVWTAEDEPRIERIVSIHIGDGWPSPQPTSVTPKVWEVLNPNGFKKTYNYTVEVELSGSGRILTDPEIQNEGQNGSDDHYPLSGDGDKG